MEGFTLKYEARKSVMGATMRNPLTSAFSFVALLVLALQAKFPSLAARRGISTIFAVIIIIVIIVAGGAVIYIIVTTSGVTTTTAPYP
jgi:hypothetical protein